MAAVVAVAVTGAGAGLPFHSGTLIATLVAIGAAVALESARAGGRLEAST